MEKRQRERRSEKEKKEEEEEEERETRWERTRRTDGGGSGDGGRGRGRRRSGNGDEDVRSSSQANGRPSGVLYTPPAWPGREPCPDVETSCRGCRRSDDANATARMGMNEEPSDLSRIFRPSQGLLAVDRDGGHRCGHSASSPASSYVWVPACSTRLPPSPSSQLELETTVVNVILQPEYVSPIVSRADVIFDSSSTGTRIAPSGTDVGFVGGFLAHSLSRKLVIKTIPRNPKRDRAIEQSIWVFEETGGPGDDDGAVRRPFLVVLVPHFPTGSSEGPFYLPDARAIAIRVAGSVLSIHRLDRERVSTGGTSVGVDGAGVDTGRDGIDSFGQGADSDRSRRMLNKLMGVVKKRLERPDYVKRVHHDTVISRERYQTVYQDLKARHADRLCRVFASNGYDGKGCREVDKIFEEVGIASFCICLWEDMYDCAKTDRPAEPAMMEEESTGGSPAPAPARHRPPFVGFVDLGCGSGVLTDVLLHEGWPGYGIDARSRKVWKSFDEGVQGRLVESILVPYVVSDGEATAETAETVVVPASGPWVLDAGLTAGCSERADGGKAESQPFYSLAGKAQVYHSGRFPEGTFLICNHGDELTAWTPLLASLNRCSFLAIPCCSFNLAGKRFRAQRQQVCADARTREASKRSTYQSLIAYVEGLCEEVGVVSEKEWLRIPSTRNLAIVGRGYRATEAKESSREALVREIIRREGGAEGWMAMVAALRARQLG
ncbi:tRNA (uracil-O(2)-)-methyltransferase [Drechslerella dactyloides]|uniref:tRNA (uracil-O(2)-)-methyltransferase n=1 Tax=Drechslerella dactyloides TaxID=74499 RepID=A0AAD6J0D7_DREDA|nr:tRNA (uracil-O(2)-)-methyltransferase [Drechslerella dactyloides]